MASEGKSGKRVVFVLLSAVAAAVFLAWFGFNQLIGIGEGIQPGTGGAPRVLSDGIIYIAEAGEPGYVTAQNIRSGKTVWKTELGTVTSPPVLVVLEDVVEVQIAGTPWMTLERASGAPVE
ncbi:MAG: hypothetical protein AAF436_04905 [Myxococcota bacterium]